MGVLVFLTCNVIVLGLLFYFCKSSKEMPKNWREFVVECKVQYAGATGIVEDIALRRRNRIELYKQSDKIVVMTGGNRGIGLAVVEKLLKCDMTVMLGVRNPETSRKTIEHELGELAQNGKIFYEKCDTEDLESVKKFADKVKERFTKIHILINNAGVMAVPFKLTKDGFEQHMAINYLGHFLLTHYLLPLLKEGGQEGKNARIVNVSSCVHKLGNINYDDFHGKKFYYPADAYNNSKLTQVLFSKHLEAIFKERGLHIQSHSLHPGVVNTDIFENSSTSYIPWFRQLLFKTPEEGSRTIVYAAIHPKLEGKGGTYFSNCFYARSHPLTKNPTELKKFFDFTCTMLNIKNFGE
jgi:NAD(P)-dependent dehydrogenase (short-subunit alcohol dehydrogenase family)